MQFDQYKRPCNLSPNCSYLLSLVQFLQVSSSPKISRMSTNSVETRVFSSLFGAIQDSGPICLDLVVPQDDRYAEDHPVVPCYQSRSATCGHLVHQGCAANYVIRCGRVFSLEYEDEVSLSEWRTRCWCRFDSDSFRTADISIGELHSSIL